MSNIKYAFVEIIFQALISMWKLKGYKGLAEYIGVPYQTLMAWKKRGSIGDYAPFMDKGISKAWLETGKGTMSPNVAFSDSQGHELRLVQKIPLLGTVPAGFPLYVAEDVVEWVYRSDLPAESYALKVKGDSMPPLIEGDFVAFIQNGDYRNGDRVVAHNEWGEFMIKRLRIRPDGSKVLTSDNPNYPDVEPNEHYRIIGKVIKAWRDIL